MMVKIHNTRVKVPTKTKSPGADIDLQKSHDALSLNPSGRGKPEYGACMRRNLINCKKVIKISTMNVRTIREQRCREELVSNLIEQNIEVLGIQEHRIVHDETVRYERILGKTLITTSATKNSIGAATGGVGLVLNTKSKSSLASIQAHSERILIANFQGNPATTVIVNYCPTNVANEDIIEGHYDNLRSAIDSIPAHNVLIVVGDFNARVGPEDAKFTYHSETNRNGKYLVELAVEKSLIISNTQFQKRNGKLWTYISPVGSKYQLDYILVRRKWQNSLMNAEAYNTFASVGSDHRIVSARIKLSLRKSKAIPRKKQYDWKAISTDTSLQERYSVEVRNRFEVLENEEESASEKYERFIKANKEAAELVIPVKKRAHKTRFSSDTRVIKARDNIRDAYETYQNNTTDDRRESYKSAKKELEDTYNLVTTEHLNGKIQEVETAHINSKHGLSWKLINEITGRKASTKGQLKGDTQKERVTNWYNHFKNLLGKPPDICDEDEEITPIFVDLDIRTGTIGSASLYL